MKKFELRGLKSLADFGRRISEIDNDVEDLRLAFYLDLRPSFWKEFGGKFYERKILDVELKSLMISGIHGGLFKRLLSMIDVSRIETLIMPDRHDMEKSCRSEEFFEKWNDFNCLKEVVIGTKALGCNVEFDKYVGFDFEEGSCRTMELDRMMPFDVFALNAFRSVTNLDRVVYYDFESEKVCGLYKTFCEGQITICNSFGELSLSSE